jgi:hypothetical protein
MPGTVPVTLNVKPPVAAPLAHLRTRAAMGA